MLAHLHNLPIVKEIIQSVSDETNPRSMSFRRSVRIPLLSVLAQKLKHPILYITGNGPQALTALDEFNFWSAERSAIGFPEPNPLFYEEASWSAATRQERIQVLTKLALMQIPGEKKNGSLPVMVAPIRSIMTKTLPRREFVKHCRSVKINQTFQLDQLMQTWMQIGYQPAVVVVEPGQFSSRGGILDLWPPSEPAPIRLDFFGDTLDTIRRFDPASQRTIENLQRFTYSPAREYFLPSTSLHADEIEKINEFHIPFLHPMSSTLLDYLPTQTLIIFEDFDHARMVAQDVEERALDQRKNSIREELLADDFPVPYYSWSEIEDELGRHHWLDFGNEFNPEETNAYAEVFKSGPRYFGQLKHFMEEVFLQLENHDQLIIVSRQANRLKEIWMDYKRHTEYAPVFIEGTISEGWVSQLTDDISLRIISDSEIFGWDRPKPRKKYNENVQAPEAKYIDFQPEDWVVHVDYGIGKYEGLVTRTLDGSEHEYLCVGYAEGDQLFVPIYQADRLTRYIGSNHTAPRPTRLGTTDWQTAKQKVRESVVEIAQELLDLYAKRQLAEGIQYEEDTAWQQELEASFPYIETEDQIRAIREIKNDMQNVRPMDRLLCGDVGYGKTEVALRAAFKAVMDSYQVAILVPTTVLAQQHFQTFQQRLAAYPVKVEMLSRFRTVAEQRSILKKLANGEIDIVIGTHRLVQSDIAFKKLGLVIIDEEQRFGVTHKEHLKKYRNNVDVLTLTATPIPRTLYMALTGVRDISTIATPPEERLPITTHVGPYVPKLVRQALIREIERGGQIYFVHNRVQSIYAMKSHLQSLVPEAKIGVGHGQMKENELSDVMDEFRAGEIDVLLCTSIIESGLDIPNANTLIVDRADTFGLAQLYQLRGRVGRGAQRAYAYFFRHRRKPSTPEGLERLDTIAENNQLGSGYSIAMRDLEMRGAGELLGTRQHGAIQSVGFHLYTQLLSQAVDILKTTSDLSFESILEGQVSASLQPPASVDLPLTIGIPSTYVPNQNMRLRLYRRISNLQQEQEVDQLVDEFNDRFGVLPDDVSNLLFQVRIKVMAQQVGITSVSMEGQQIVCQYPTLPEGIRSRNLPAMGHGERVGKNAYWLSVSLKDKHWQEQLVAFMRVLIELKKNNGKFVKSKMEHIS
ncbi:MAG: transcription-repair coupling factor [Anaerolineaceae bacterium]|nr:transcription-repair coupling factor [Anaerolineaceae bacterium]